MNREQRRAKPCRAKRAALALLVAGTLAAGAVTDLYAEAANTSTDELSIHGGGGGGGNAGCGVAGGGGGGYIEYKTGSNTFVSFGGGGDGSDASVTQGGSIGGGRAGTVGGGASGSFLGGTGSNDAQGNGTTKVPNANTEAGIGAYTTDPFPVGWLLQTDLGTDGQAAASPYTGGYGGSAELTISGNLSLGVLNLTAGSDGNSSNAGTDIGVGGAGGSAELEVDGKLDARDIRLFQPASGGTVTLYAGTMIIGLNYQLNNINHAITNPDFTVAAYEFDLEGVTDGDTLLNMSADPFTISWISGKSIAFTNPGLSALSVGDKIILISDVTGTATFADVTAGSYTFELEVTGGALVATVTGAPANVPGPEAESQRDRVLDDHYPTGDSAYTNNSSLLLIITGICATGVLATGTAYVVSQRKRARAKNI